MVEITLPIILQIVQTVGILVGIIYYITIMRNTQKTRELTLQSQELTRKAQEQTLETRQTQLFMQIFEQLSNEESMQSWAELVNKKVPDYDEFLLKYDSSVNPAHYAKRSRLWYSFNTIGELHRLGIIELDLAHRLQLSPMVITMWENWEHIIREIRARENAPEICEGFEYLYNELKRLRKEKGYPKYNYPQPA
jgi:hypothetical protein